MAYRQIDDVSMMFEVVAIHRDGTRTALIVRDVRATAIPRPDKPGSGNYRYTIEVDAPASRSQFRRVR